MFADPPVAADAITAEPTDQERLIADLIEGGEMLRRLALGSVPA